VVTNRQMVINLDCVGDGNHLRFFPTKGLKKNTEFRKLSRLAINYNFGIV
jgi:hypothetical protein